MCGENFHFNLSNFPSDSLIDFMIPCNVKGRDSDIFHSLYGKHCLKIFQLLNILPIFRLQRLGLSRIILLGQISVTFTYIPHLFEIAVESFRTPYKPLIALIF